MSISMPSSSAAGAPNVNGSVPTRRSAPPNGAAMSAAPPAQPMQRNEITPSSFPSSPHSPSRPMWVTLVMPPMAIADSLALAATTRVSSSAAKCPNPTLPSMSTVGRGLRHDGRTLSGLDLAVEDQPHIFGNPLESVRGMPRQVRVGQPAGQLVGNVVRRSGGHKDAPGGLGETLDRKAGHEHPPGPRRVRMGTRPAALGRIMAGLPAQRDSRL